MKKFVSPVFASILLVSLGCGLQAQTITNWTGADDDDFNNSLNWDNGLPSISISKAGVIGTVTVPNPTVGIDSGVNAVITQNGGTVSFDNPQLLQGTYNLEGGTLAYPTGGNDAIRLSGTLNVDGGSLIEPTGAIGSDGIEVRAGANLNILSGSQNLGVGRLWNQDGGMTVDGASFASADFWMGSFAGTQETPTMLLQNGGSVNVTGLRFVNTGGDLSTITFGSGINSLTAAGYTVSGFDSAFFNFTSGSVGSTLTITGFSDWEQAYTDGNLLYDGGNTQPFASVFSLTGDTLTVVPEPGTLALLAAGMIGLGCACYARRRIARG